MSEQPILPPLRFLLVEDDADSRVIIARWLRANGHEVEETGTLAQAIERYAACGPDAVCLDLGLPDASGTEALDTLRRRDPSIPVVVLTAETEVEMVVTSVQKGAFGYLAKPVPRDKLLEIARRAGLRGRMERVVIEKDEKGGVRGSARLGGPSPAMNELRLRVRRVATSDVNVLVQGESGVGKELVARAVHEESARRDNAFVALNCAAIPEALQESELFGHERGSFTGAHQQKRGYFELAAGGTLFLDEVAELAPSLQAKLLRCVQEKAFRRVGGTVDVASDFRIVAASHKNLWEEVASGRFRADLYYRLAVFELLVPPLRDRGEDILFLSQMFIKDQFPDGHVTLSPEVEQMLLRYPWPGNVRELKNALHHALVLRTLDILTVADFPERVRSWVPAPPSDPMTKIGPPPSSAPAAASVAVPATIRSDEPTPTPAPTVVSTGERRVRLDELERQAIVHAIAAESGSVTRAARTLGISRATLYRRLKQYQEEVPEIAAPTLPPPVVDEPRYRGFKYDN